MLQRFTVGSSQTITKKMITKVTAASGNRKDGLSQARSRNAINQRHRDQLGGYYSNQGKK